MPADLKPDKIITLALKRFKLIEDAERDLRKLALEDIKFAKDSEQWPDTIRATRNMVGQERPCLVINRMPQFIRQVTNDERMNRPAIKIDPVDEATIDDAKIREGLIRHIQVASNADIAYDTACDNQVTCGFGYIRLITEYCNDTSFDQEIRIKRIKNPLIVYFDPFAIEPDYSDAKYCFIVADMPRSEFESEYSGNKDYSSEVFKSIGDNGPTWGNDDIIRIAEYFEVSESPKKIYLLNDSTTTDKEPDENAVGADMQPLTVVDKRDTSERKVIWRKITAMEVLEEKEWPGIYIPIIPVLGEDTDIDGKRVLKGMVRDAKDPQRMYNYMASAETEAIALSPKAPFIIAEGQVEGYEDEWDTANIRSYSRLTYKPTSIDGIQVPMPMRQQAEPPIQAIATALAQADRDIMNTTGIYQAGLGQRSNETSGKAIVARQHEGDISNFHYVDNLSRAIRFVGVQCLDLFPKIYDAPRAIRILHEDGEAEIIKINQMFEHNGKQVNYDMNNGKFDVVVNVGPSFTTRRQEAAASMVQMIQAAPQLMSVIGDIMVRNMDWPEAQEAAERIKKMLPPQLQDDQQGQQQIPPQVQQQLQQSQQMIQQLTQALNQAHDERDAKTQELQSKERIAEQDNQTKIAVAEINNHMKVLSEELKHMREHAQMNIAQIPNQSPSPEIPQQVESQ